MRIIISKRCADCGVRRGFLERLAAHDDELCDDCYFKFIDAVRERSEKREEQEGGSRNKNAP